MRKSDVLHRNTGVRAKFKGLLDDRHFRFPLTTRPMSKKDEYGNPIMRSLLTHPVGWYLDARRIGRPLTFAYSMAVFSEYCLALSRRKNAGVRDATDFFADTRRLLQYIISNVRADRRLRGKQAEAMAARFGSLQQKARNAWAEIHASSPLTPSTGM